MSDLTEAQDRLAWRAEGALDAVVMKELARFDDWRKALTDLASQLRSWQNAAKSRSGPREPRPGGGRWMTTGGADDAATARPTSGGAARPTRTTST